MPDDSNAAPRPRKGRPKNPAAMALAKAHSLAELRRKHEEVHQRSHYSQDYRQADLFDEAIGIKKRQIEYRRRQRAELKPIPLPQLADAGKSPTEPFGMIPVRMFGRVRKSAIHVYAALAGEFAMRGENRTWVSVAKLVEVTGLSRRMVRYATEELEGDYWIETIRTGRANRYRALPWPEVRLRQEFAAQSDGAQDATNCTSDVQPVAPNKEEETKTSIEASIERGREAHAALFGDTGKGTRTHEPDPTHIADFLGRRG